MPNITQFPILPIEYLRIFSLAGDGRIGGIDIYPMQNFRISTSEFTKVLGEAVNKANQQYSEENINACHQILNYCVNEGLSRLDAAGQIIKMEKSRINYIEEHGNEVVAQTSDGYTIFNFGRMPPTPSPKTH